MAEAIAVLQAGGVVAIPTETVYGLAAKISDESAIRKIFSTKNRPFFDPLIVHVSSIIQAQSLVHHWPRSADLLARKFWPGPLTLVLPKKEQVSDLITSGLDTVAIRMPRHPVALALLEALGEPLAAPSANRFGRTSPSAAEHVRDEFGEAFPILEGGTCDVGIESTIIKLQETEAHVDITLLRAGSILPEQILGALSELGKTIKIQKPGRNIEAPGQVKHHYMPAIPILLIDRAKWDLARGQLAPLIPLLRQNFKHPTILQLSPSPEQAARELYAQMRHSSAPPNDLIIFIKEPFHQGEFWTALLDRLNRASSFQILSDQ